MLSQSNIYNNVYNNIIICIINIGAYHTYYSIYIKYIKVYICRLCLDIRTKKGQCQNIKLLLSQTKKLLYNKLVNCQRLKSKWPIYVEFQW